MSAMCRLTVVFVVSLAYGVAGDAMQRQEDLIPDLHSGVVELAPGVAQHLYNAHALSSAAQIAIQAARAHEAAARAAQANAIHNARENEAARIANVHRAESAAADHLQATNAATSAARAGANHLIRASEAQNLADEARRQAIRIANSHAEEIGRLAQAAREQALAVAANSARTQAIADEVAKRARLGAIRESSVVVAPSAALWAPHVYGFQLGRH